MAERNPRLRRSHVDDRWERYEDEMWGRGLEHYKERLAGLPRTGNRMLDLGCGAGQWCAAALAQGMSVVGCDKQIRRRAAGLRVAGRRFDLVQAGAEALPFADGSFDLVLCHLILPYVAVDVSVREMKRVLQVGGILNGVCHGSGYYLMQAWREIGNAPWRSVRRMLVLAYTVVHRTAGLRRYFFETFQSPERFGALLSYSGFEVLSLKLGGHPVMPEVRFARLPVFFEFVARKVRAQPSAQR